LYLAARRPVVGYVVEGQVRFSLSHEAGASLTLRMPTMTRARAPSTGMAEISDTASRNRTPPG